MSTKFDLKKLFTLSVKQFRILEILIEVAFFFLFATTLTFNYVGEYHLNYLTWASFALVCTLLIYWCICRRRFRFDSFGLFVVLFALVILISNLINTMSVSRSFLTIFLSAITVLLFYQFFSIPDYRKKCLRVMVLSYVFFFVCFIIHYRQAIIHLDFSSRLDEFFADQNILGYILTYGFLLTFYCALFQRKYYLFVLSLMSLAFIGMTGSRSALLIAVFCSFALVVFYFGRRRWYISLAIIVGFIVTFVLLFSLPPLQSLRNRFLASLVVLLNGTDSSDYSTALRLEFVPEGLEMFLKKPFFGYGVNAIFRQFSIDGNDTHNNFVELLVDYGLFAFVLYEGFLVYSASKIIRTKNESKYLFLTWLIAIFLTQFFYPIYPLKVEFILLCFIAASYKLPDADEVQSDTAHKATEIAKKFSINKIVPLVVSALSAVISLLTTYFIAKPLGPTLYGKVQFYVGVASILSVVGSLGLNDFLTKNIQFASDKKGAFSKYILLMALWNTIIFPIYVVIAFFFLKTFEQNWLIILAVGGLSLVLSLLSIVSSYLVGVFKQGKASLLTSLLPKALILTGSIIFIYLFNMTDSFADNYVYFCLSIYAILDISFLVRLLKRTRFKFTKSEIVQLLVFFAIACTYGLNTSLAKVIGSEYYNKMDAVGAYALSAQIVTVATLFSSTITAISKPFFAALKDKPEELMDYFRKVTRINAFIVIPFCMGFIIQASTLLSIFGDDYVPFSAILIILCVSTLIADLAGPNGGLLAMSGHEKLELINGFVNIGTFLGFAFSFKGLGLNGLAWATLASDCATHLLKFIEVWVAYKKCPYNLKLMLHFAILTIISGGVFFLLNLIPNMPIRLFSDAVFGTALIFGFLIINPNKNDKFFFFKRDDKVI
jgi:O-antigen/teichoic acid export membrane protein/O-antigen ligase